MKSSIFRSLIMGIFIFSACGEQRVYFKGALCDIMQKGDISARIKLDSFKEDKHLYALGAVENLKGEILIYDGHPTIASVSGTGVSIDHTYNSNAALLVYARVAQWQEFDLPGDVLSYKDLERVVLQKAKKAGLDVSKPFPFLLEGNAVSVTWHVINWQEGDNEHTHEKHKKSGLRGVIADTQVEVLGFYSDRHHGIFTHHSTNMHLHVKTKDGKLAGHADDLIFHGRGKTTLFLPLS